MAELHVHASKPEVVEAFTRWVEQIAAESIVARGRFRWALSGGSTPARLFDGLAGATHQSEFPWSQTDLFWGDERDVHPTHLDSNYGMTRERLLMHLNPPPHGVFRWVTEYGPVQALADYRGKLSRCPIHKTLPNLDLVMLGLGPEGHTASLFPESPVLEVEDWVAHVYVPSHQTWRYTLTLPVINHARHVAFLVTGEEKRAIVRRVLGSNATRELPASLVQPVHGPAHWFLDRDAYPTQEAAT